LQNVIETKQQTSQVLLVEERG